MNQSACVSKRTGQSTGIRTAGYVFASFARCSQRSVVIVTRGSDKLVLCAN